MRFVICIDQEIVFGRSYEEGPCGMVRVEYMENGRYGAVIVVETLGKQITGKK